MQKIHIIEPYVSAVGFVDNPESNNSRLQTLTIDEYQARRLAHLIARGMVVAEPTAEPAGSGAATAAGPVGGWLRYPISSMRLAADVLAARARAVSSPSIWTRPAEVRAAVKKRWDSGTLLTRFAAGQDWEPLGIPIHGPSASLIGERLAEVRQWAAEWAEAARGPPRVEYKQVGGRHVGTNSIPCRA